MNTRPDDEVSGPIPVDLQRRKAIKLSGLVISFMVLGVGGKAMAITSARRQPGDVEAAMADGNPPFAPNAFIRIDTDGTIRLVMAPIEMGQGSYTGVSMLIAEELGIDLDQVTIEHSPPNQPLYGMPLLQIQATGGSTTIRGTWQVFREAGAVARTMLVSAAATQWKVDPATCTVERAVVIHAASGRKLGFGELATAAGKLPMPDKVTLKDPKDFKLIGKSLRRVDTALKTDGSVKFGIDTMVPGMKFATVLACPTFAGKLVSVDETAARKIPGVIDVVKLDNAVAVTGEHFWAAKQGLDALKIVWDRGVNANLTTEDIYSAMDNVSREGKAIVAREVGDQNPPKGKSLESIYKSPILAHAPMEPLNATVHVTADKCEIWVGTQVPTRCVDVAVKVTGLPSPAITVNNHYLGGGFGRRLEVDNVEQAVAIAKQVPYPVKVVWTREEDIRHDIVRPPYLDHYRASLAADGSVTHWYNRLAGPSIVERWLPPALRKNGLDSDLVEGAEEPPYDLPNLHVEWHRYQMPPGMLVGWWRGVGQTHNLFGIESFIDELAEASGKGPLAYRRMLLAKNPRTLAVVNAAAEKFGWDDNKTLPAGTGRGMAVGQPFGSFICVMIEVDVSPQGVVALKRALVAIDCGIAINPNSVVAQLEGGLIFGWSAALHSGIKIENGAIVQSNFHDYRIMRINEAPAIEVYILPSAEPPGGLGETGTAIAAPALTNAIYSATRIRIRELPISRTSLVRDSKALDAAIAMTEVDKELTT
jgi:isoquinoline 1-oxidoreductase subunit beta